MSDYTQYAQQTAIALLGEPGQKVKANDWRWGSHGSLSVDPETGKWYDHEEQVGGGVLDLIMREAGRATERAAIRWLEEQGIKPEDQPEKSKQRQKVVATYDYVDEDGQLLFQVCRMEPKSFRQRRPQEGGGWNWSVKGVRQIPYRLPDLEAKPNATTLIVEGEKDADRLADEFGLVATCNAGGAGKFPDSLVPYFEGRPVVILPDNDKAGADHAEAVASRLHEVADSVRIVHLPGLPEKGDVSDWIDAGGDRAQLIELCKGSELWAPSQADDAPAVDSKPEPTPEPEPEEAADPPSSGSWPFRPLGYDENNYYYLPERTLQVTAIAAGGHTNKSYLLTLAPLEWWEASFPSKGGPDWTMAANACMRACETVGTFDPERIRGRGAWYDNGRSVLHLGNRLQVDGDAVNIEDHRTHYIYERKPAMEALKAADPLDDDEALHLHAIMGKLNWPRPVNATLLAGWCVLAPVCGALSWRPHCWLTGKRGSGKSWVVDNIVDPTLGASAVTVQSNSTEAGIRQKMKQDARPVVFDEAEGESASNRNRMQSVLELARQASSESSSEIAKGTAGGKAMSFRVRSMFLMGSINVGLAQASDKSRFTVLTLGQPRVGAEGRADFEDLERAVNSTLTEDYCARLRSRTYNLIPQIRMNADTLSKAAAEIIGNQRAGDQLGTLLAGAYSLFSSGVISIDQAREWVSGQDWGMASDDEVESDEQALASELLHHQIIVEASNTRHTRSIAELIRRVCGMATDTEVDTESAHEALTRHGFKVRDQRIMVSESHPELRKALHNTAWGGGWGRILERIEAAEKHDCVRFAGLRHRAVSFPVGAILSSD